MLCKLHEVGLRSMGSNESLNPWGLINDMQISMYNRKHWYALSHSLHFVRQEGRLAATHPPSLPRVVQYSQIDSVGVSGNKKGLHWYQWYDWYQWKSNLFQWFCRWICISLRGLRLFSHVVWPGTGQFQWSIGTNGTIGTNRKAPYSNGSVGEYASH